jgi:hypothetical protein
MPKVEDVLREKTYKGEGLDLDVRVFYTLRDGRKLQPHRNSKAIALIVKLLHKKGLVSVREIDQLLLDCIQG